MSRGNAADQVAVLVAAFHRERIGPDTVALYAHKLADIDRDLLAAAVNRLVEDSKFFPTISEIRHMAARLAGLLPPSPAEALALVRRADVSRPVYRRDGTYAYTEHEWDWTGISESDRAFCESVIERVGDPVNFSTDEKHFGWDTGFQKLAEETAKDDARAALADMSLARLPAADEPRKLLR